MTHIALNSLDAGAREALAVAWSVLPEARLVGGVVRDLIADAPISDLDLGVPAPPDAVMRRLSEAGIRCLPTGLSHGTVTALIDKRAIEITSLRRDEQTDGRHAVVAWTTDWREDAQRRDFTINAMSLSRDGELFDYFGGGDDLRAHRVRFVGDAASRIAEDGLRILRFFRFNARYGSVAPDLDAAGAIAASLSSLDQLSKERIWSELRRILTGPQLDATLQLMRVLGVLDRLFPDGANDRLPARVPADPILRLAALVRGHASGTARALRLSNHEAARLDALLTIPAPSYDFDDAALRRVLADNSADLLCGAAWLARAASDCDPRQWADLRQRLATIARPEFPLKGRDILNAGIIPGEEVGRLLKLMRHWWMEGGCVASHDACVERLHVLAGRPF